MSELAIAPLLISMVTCVLTVVVRKTRLQQVVSLAGILGYAAAVGALVWAVIFAPDRSPLAYQMGGWPAPHGITLVADGLSVFFLALTAVVATYALSLSILTLEADIQRLYYHPLYHFMILGATGAILTGDLFNLFVWFEVMLLASYVFVAFYGAAGHTAAAVRYVVLNVIGGVIMLLAIGGLYATTGTINMAAMADRLADGSATGMEPALGFAALLLATFALKAGLVPFQFWIPAAYRSAPLPITATFAGATKKVGIYAICRLLFTVFEDASVSTSIPGLGIEGPLAVLGAALLVMACLSILVGGIGALSRNSLDDLLAYSSIGQAGFIALPLAIAALANSTTLQRLGVLAALIFAAHHAVTKSLLFLATGVIDEATGTRQLPDLGGIVHRSPAVSTVFLVGGFSLVGIPPLVGFFGKLLVFDVAARSVASVSTPLAVGVATVVVLVVLGGAILTILYVSKAVLGGFWGAQSDPVKDGQFQPTAVVVLASFAAGILVVGLTFEPLYQAADVAAHAALDSDAYVDAVDPIDGVEPVEDNEPVEGGESNDAGGQSP